MKGNRETEIVFYCLIGNPEGLNQADRVEDHVQIEVRTVNGHKLRVRKTSDPDGSNVKYEYTGKKKNKGDLESGPKMVQDSVEFDSPITEEMFNAFAQTAEQKIEKRRYYFKNCNIILTLGDKEDVIVLDNVGYEVDVFKTDGKFTERAKIDVETDPILEYIEKHYPDLKDIAVKVKPGSLPFEPNDYIFPPTASPEKKKFIEDLWANTFTTKL